MATRAQQSFIRPVVAAIADGATTPDPGITNTVAYSTTTGTFVRWTGTAWAAITGSSGTAGPSYASTMKYGVD